MARSPNDAASSTCPLIETQFPCARNDQSKAPMQLDECDYELPAHLIAQHPLKVRDRARLLILDRTQMTMTHRHVRDLVTVLTPQDVLVINDTKVFPARLLGRRRDSGGRVEILLVRPV